MSFCILFNVVFENHSVQYLPVMWGGWSIISRSNVILATPCGFQQGGILTSVDSDQPVQPPFKRRNSK